MKGLKIIFPIMGVFLVFYIASVVMNGVKMNGIVAQLNELYDEDFTIVASSMGNVFLDEDFELAARSNKTERVYEFIYNEGTITGDYNLENKLYEISDGIKQQLPGKSIVLTKTSANAKAPENNITDSLHVIIIVEENAINLEGIANKVKNTYEEEQVDVVFYEGVATQVDKVATEIVKYYPQSEITDELLSSYKLKKSKYVD